MTWTVREERTGDEPAIHRVTRAAFAGQARSDGTEPAIIDALRADGDLALSLVAEADGAIVGHVAFSPATLSSGEPGWLTLGPVSVHPGFQRQGIARALIEAGVAYWRHAGASGVVLVGSPDFYGRFGFARGTSLRVAGPLAPYFQVHPFTDEIPAASVTFASAFDRARP